MPETPPICPTCQQFRAICFCEAPRTRELYEKRLRWANIEHPPSDDISKKIERIIAEPQKWMDFAKELEREIKAMQKRISQLERRPISAEEILAL